MSETISTSIADYLRQFAGELEDRILQQFPPLHNPNDPVWPGLRQLKRKPYAAQTLAAMGIVKQWERARAAAAIAECGTGKTLISLGAVHTHARGRAYTCLAMAPPHVVMKWARECFLTLPRVRVFLIDGIRNGVGSNGHTGVNELRLRRGAVVREGLHTTLSELRLSKNHRSARARWQSICSGPAVFLVSRERAKLGYHWRHAFRTGRCPPYAGIVVNPDTGRPIIAGEDQLRRADFKKAKRHEVLLPEEAREPAKARRQLYSALWQADESKLRRYAPIEFIGRYMSTGFFDYGIADEVHELKGGATAQGNAMGTLASCAGRVVILTGTLLGGYADELFNILFRLDPAGMLAQGFEYGEAGVRAFTECYGVLEKVTIIEPADNSCSKAKTTKRMRRRPGASPLLFGHFLMNLGAFVSLEDISAALPPYREDVIDVEMDPPLATAYRQLEDDIKTALQEHRGNQSVMSVGLNSLLLYPDRPFALGTLYGYALNEETGRRERFVISEPEDLDTDFVYAKERSLVEEVKAELGRGRRCQIYAVYTKKRDVTRRLAEILSRERIRVAVLTTDVPPERREAWYERQIRQGVQVVIAHPRLVQTGLDLLSFPSIFFYQTGYSIYTLRQASRRSWRIGQKQPVRVVLLHYATTMQESCLRLMGKKLLVSLAMEGKFSNEGLQALDADDDMLTAMARELVTQKGIGERSEGVWKALQQEHEHVAPRTSAPEPPTREVVEFPAELPLMIPGEMPTVQPGLFDGMGKSISGLVAFAEPPPMRKRTSRRPQSLGEQLSLRF